jgi:hypothetical protein
MEERPEQPEIGKRDGNTSRELDHWIETYPDDQDLRIEASFIRGMVEGWKTGTITGTNVIRRIYRRYVATEDGVSEMASTILMQAPMWFGYEADISPETDAQISHEVLGY